MTYWKANDECRNCKEPLVEGMHVRLSKKILRRKYHFCRWLRCTNCGNVYMNMKDRVFPEEVNEKCICGK